MGYTLKNSAVGNNFFNASGTALSSTIQPKVIGGATAGIDTAQISSGLLDGVDKGNLRSDLAVSVKTSERNGYRELFVSATGNIVSVADNGAGLCDLTVTSHGLSANDTIYLENTTSGLLDGVHNIVSVPDANSLVTDRTYIAGVDPGGYRTGSATQFAAMTPNAYVIRRVTQTLAGNQSNTKLLSGGSDFGRRRSINKHEAFRVVRVATAIRNGYWNEYAGTWSTDPTEANDYSAIGVDDAANPTRAIPGELVYKEPKPLPVQDDYKAKTNG